MELIWNVYIEDPNNKCIKTYNIFNHYCFKQDLVKLYEGNICGITRRVN